MNRICLLLIVSCSMLLVAAHANAGLIVRGTATIMGVDGDFQVIYDDALKVTWLDYTNQTGDWSTQKTWADGLEVVFEGRLFDNWRLPATDESVVNMSGPYVYPESPYYYQEDGPYGYAGPDPATGRYDYRWGYNMVNNELGHLFYVSLENLGLVGTLGEYPQTGWGLDKTDPFVSLQRSYYYTGNEFTPNPDWAWGFGMNAGLQVGALKSYKALGIAVLPGDIAAVPLPSALWIFLSGVSALGLVRHRSGNKNPGA